MGHIRWHGGILNNGYMYADMLNIRLKHNIA